MKKLLFLCITHLIVGIAGFAYGIYLLPILTAPPPPAVSVVLKAATTAEYKGVFKKELQDSDSFHWGDGEVFISDNKIILMGELSPGPDYKLYLTNEFVETEKEFNRIKGQSVRVGDIKTFKNFILDVPENVNVEDYKAVVIWCETFSQFITAASYR